MFTLKRFLFVIALLATLQSTFAQESLPSDVFQKVSNSVFEVVVPRPGDDTLEYEKPLPLDRLPYTERTDKYMSIGTAFLLDDGLFYSAAHVFNLREESQNNDYFIRDAQGEVYAIDTLYKFSNERDFIVFSATNFTAKPGQGLQAVSEKPAINTTVYTVGNALGEGIVVRNGVFTSETFEDINGAWKWVRFSAAASPGNSGGPLITNEGNVVGIVTMKNQNENLNYALPIQEVEKSPTDSGEYILRVFYQLPNILSDKKYGEFELNFSLPKTFADSRDEVKTAYQKFTKNLSDEFRAEFSFDSESSFTNLETSGDIMYSSYTPDFPLTMINHEDKRWGLHYPQEINDIRLPRNGSVEYGVMIDYYFINITSPDNVPVKTLINSPKMYMDYILETAILWRNMAGERITITSLGDPVITETHVDSFERTWMVSYWNLEFADYMVITYALPVPGGIFLLMQIQNTGTILDGVNIDLAFMSDYMFMGYSATMEDWEEFLALSEDEYPLYPPFANMEVSITKQHTVVESDRWKIQLPQKTMKVDKKTKMNIPLAYNYEDSVLTFVPRGLTLYHSPVTQDYRYLAFEEFLKPEEDANKQLLNVWETLENENYPFNTTPYYQDSVTNYNEVLDFLPNNDDAQSAMLLMLEIHGDVEDEILDFASEVKDSLTIQIHK